MPAFQHVPHPVFSPTRCTTCHTSRCDKGFVDLLVDDEAVNGYDEVGGAPVIAQDGQTNFGHLYMCVGCAEQLGTVIGYASKQHTIDALGVVDEQAETIASLEAELAAALARPLEVVSVDELLSRAKEEPVAA